jgi:hypothetical protein
MTLVALPIPGLPDVLFFGHFETPWHIFFWCIVRHLIYYVIGI